METPNAIKICMKMGGYKNCYKCPLFAVCDSEYTSTEEFEKAIEAAATEYIKDHGNAI